MKIMGEVGSVSRAIGSNITAEVQSLFGAFKRMPLLGITSKGEKALARNIAAIKRTGADSTKKAHALVKQGTEEISDMLSDAARRIGDEKITAETIGKEISRAYGLEGEARARALGGIAEKYGLTQDNLNTIDRTMGLSQRVADRYMAGAMAPFNMVKEYALDGSPLSVYAKGATAVTIAQFMNGSRTSLTEQNGQRDIAGIPFI
jgi:hypothetical protein